MLYTSMHTIVIYTVNNNRTILEPMCFQKRYHHSSQYSKCDYFFLRN